MIFAGPDGFLSGPCSTSIAEFRKLRIIKRSKALCANSLISLWAKNIGKVLCIFLMTSCKKSGKRQSNYAQVPGVH